MASVYWRRSTVPARVAFLNTSSRFIRFLRNDLSIISRLISCHSWNSPLLSIPTLYTHHAKNVTGLWAGQGVLTVPFAWNALPPNIYIASSAQMFSLKCHLIRASLTNCCRDAWPARPSLSLPYPSQLFLQPLASSDMIHVQWWVYYVSSPPYGSSMRIGTLSWPLSITNFWKGT